MASKNKPGFLTQVFDDPERLRERLVLAIALAPPKARGAAARGKNRVGAAPKRPKKTE